MSVCANKQIPICPPAGTTRLPPPPVPGTTHQGVSGTTTALPVTHTTIQATTIKPQTSATKTIVPSKPSQSQIVKSTHISLPGKQVNVLTIQNNFKISFGGKKSNITQPGSS